MKLIFLGPPGAGKGTHAQRLAQEENIPQISTGEILRKAMKEKTPTGLAAQAYVDRGELVPDDVVIAIVRERLAEKDCDSGYILDGFPRTLDQAEALSEFAQIDAVVNFSLKDETIIERLSGRRTCPECGFTGHVKFLDQAETCPECGKKLTIRKDDQPETIANRLSVYAGSTAPLIDYYQNRDILRTVDCEGGTVEDNHARLRKVLSLS